MRERPQVTLDSFELLLLAVVCVSGASVALLVVEHFSPLTALGAGTVLTLLLVLSFRIRLVPGMADISPWLLVILVVAVVYRADPYLTLLGGSDEGIYLSMAASFERTGRPEVVDEFRARLNPEEKAYFDDTNLGLRAVPVRGKHEGNRFPGVDVRSRAKSEYVFQFYPLHSLWMSIFGRLFGAPHRPLSLLFFSLLSVCSIYFLTLGLSRGSRFASLTAAFLLAVNPLDVLFSNFPTSEVVSLAFCLAAFYMLLRFYQSEEHSPERPCYLAISAGAMGCLFFTHLRGLVYLPFFYLLLLAVIVCVDDRQTKRQFFVYLTSILVLYVLSLVYGHEHDYGYYTAIFDAYLRLDRPGATLRLALEGAGLVGTAVLATALRRLRVPLTKSAESAIPWVFLLVFGATVASSGVFGVPRYLEQYTYGGFSGAGWASVRSSMLAVLAYYISPPGLLLLLLFVITASRQRSTHYCWLLVFLTLMWTANLITAPFIPDYYRARYLLPEVMPSSLIVMALALQWLWEKGSWWRRLSLLSIVGIGAFLLYFTTLQMQGKIKDAEDMHLDRIANIVQPADVLFVKMAEPLGKFVSTPLETYYGLTVVETDDLHRALEKFWRVLAPEDVPFVYLLSEERTSDSVLKEVDAFKFSVRAYAHDVIPMVPIIWGTRPFHLYRIDRDNLTTGCGDPPRNPCQRQ